MNRLSLDTSIGMVDVAYVERGAGPTIVCVHGWGHTSEVWSEISAILMDHYRVVALDLPGFGQSPPLPFAHLELADFAQVLHAALKVLNVLERPALLVADSFGALLTLECMSRSDSAVPQNVFLSGCPLDGLPPLIRNLNADAFTGVGLRLLKAMPFSIAHTLASRSNRVTVQKKGDFERIITRMIRSADPSTARKTLRQMYRPYELSEHFRAERFAITLCRGAEDRVLRAVAFDTWAKALSAHSAVLPGLGHTPMLEGPDEYAHAIADALGRIEAAPTPARQ